MGERRRVLTVFLVSVFALACRPLVGLDVDAAAGAANEDGSGAPDAGGFADRPSSNQLDAFLSDSRAADSRTADSGRADRPSAGGCYPPDQESCTVQARKDGVSCPPNWTEAKRLPCTTDNARRWQLDGCAGYVSAYWTEGLRDEWCLYHPGTRQLVAYKGHDPGGADYAGRNDVMCGSPYAACRPGHPVPATCESPPTTLPDAGVTSDGAASPTDAHPPGACGQKGQPCCPSNRCLAGCCVPDGSSTGVCAGVGEACDSSRTCLSDSSCQAPGYGSSVACFWEYCGGSGESCCSSAAGNYCAAPDATCVPLFIGTNSGYCQPCGGASQPCCSPTFSAETRTCRDGLTCRDGASRKVCCRNHNSKEVACAGRSCGSADNGCGGFHDCGTCNWPETCGGGGTQGVCGCQSSMAAACRGSCGGPARDGCGILHDCPPACPADQRCQCFEHSTYPTWCTCFPK